MAKPVTAFTTFGSNTTGTTTQLDNNFLTLKNAVNDLNTYSNYLLDTGSANTVVVALAANLTGALTDGLMIQVKVAATNTGASTLNYNAGGALNILNLDGSALTGGQIPGGAIVSLQYRSSDTAWILQTPFGSSSLSISGRNRLINASFAVDQRNGGNTVVVADDNYGPDRWNILTQNTNCNVGIQTNQTNGIPTNVLLTQTGGTAARMGLEQIVESINCRDMRGANAVLSGAVFMNEAGNVRYAIIEHTGTADTLTSDYVNDWNSASYATGGFFISANTTITAVGVTTLAGNTWTNISPLIGNVSANMVNLTAFLWTEANANQNTTLAVGRLQLEQGSSPTPFERVTFGDDLERASRYYTKTFNYATAPAQSAGVGGAIYSAIGAAVAGGITGGWKFCVPMRAAPTIVTFNPSNNNALWRRSDGGTEVTATALSAGTAGITLGTSDTPTATNYYFIHATAAAEL